MLSNLEVDRNVVGYFYTLIGNLKKLRATADKTYKIGIFTFLWIIFNHYYRTLRPAGKDRIVECSSEPCAIKAFFEEYQTELDSIFDKMLNERKIKDKIINVEPFANLNPTNGVTQSEYIREFLRVNRVLYNDNSFELVYHSLTDFNKKAPTNERCLHYLLLMYCVRNLIMHGSLVIKNDEFDQLLDFSVETFVVFIEHLANHKRSRVVE